MLTLRPLLLLVFCLGLGCASPKTPNASLVNQAAASTPILELATHVSDRADIVFVLSSPRVLLQQLQANMANAPRDKGTLADISARVGLSDVLNPAAWETTGIHIDRPALLLTYLKLSNRPASVLAFELRDSAKFRAHMEKIDGPLRSDVEGGGWIMTNSGVMWRKDDTRVFVALQNRDVPALEDIACRSCATMPTSPLSASPDFIAFQRHLLERGHPVGVFVSPTLTPLLKELWRELRYDRDLDAGHLFRMFTQTRGVGVTASLDAKGANVDAWLGTTPDLRARVSRLLAAPAQDDLGLRVPKDALLVSRMTLDPRVAVQELARVFSNNTITLASLQAKKGVPELNLRRDLFDAFGEDATVVLYPGNLNNPALLFAQSLRTPKAAQKLLAAMKKRGAPIQDMTLGKSTVSTIRIPWLGRAYISNTHLLLSTSDVGERDIQRFLEASVPAKEGFTQVQGPNLTYVKVHAIAAGLGLPPKEVALMPEVVRVQAKQTRDALTAQARLDGVQVQRFLPFFQLSLKRAKTKEAEEVMRKMANGAKAYFTSEQIRSTSAGNQPWHPGITIQGKMNTTGMPIPWVEYAFPGGTSYSFTTSATIPEAGATVPPAARTLKGDAAYLDATLNRLNISFLDPLRFRYTYETGPDAGDKAYVILRAEADFNPKTPAKHTITQRIYVDPTTQEVIVAPPVTTNEYE